MYIFRKSQGKTLKKPAGDLIYMIDGEEVTSSDMLVRQIQNHEVGDTVTFTIVRNDEMLQIEVVLQDSNEVNK